MRGTNVINIGSAVNLDSPAVFPLISYTTSAAILLSASSRLSGRSILSMVVPGREEVRVLVAGVRRMAGRAGGRVRRDGSTPGVETGTPT